MTSEALNERARPVMAVAATLFVVDLFLGWQRVAVQMPAIDVRSTASGWGGWGALVGRTTPATVALGLGVLVFTALQVLAGHANVDVGASMMRVHVDTTLWPAWVGLALAGVMAAAAVVPYLAMPGERTPTTIAPHGPG